MNYELKQKSGANLFKRTTKNISQPYTGQISSKSVEPYVTRSGQAVEELWRNMDL